MGASLLVLLAQSAPPPEPPRMHHTLPLGAQRARLPKMLSRAWRCAFPLRAGSAVLHAPHAPVFDKTVLGFYGIASMRQCSGPLDGALIAYGEWREGSPAAKRLLLLSLGCIFVELVRCQQLETV